MDSVHHQNSVENIIRSSLILSSEIQMIQVAAIEIISAEWMHCSENYDKESLMTTEQTRFVSDLLNALHHKIMDEKKHENDKNASSNVITSSNTEEMKIAQKLNCASASAKALLALQYEPLLESSTSGEVENNLIRSITDDSVMRSEKWIDSYDNLTSELGFSYLEFLVCWSGFHRSPWPYCTLPEARILCSKARYCLDASKRNFGRTTAVVLESAIIDLAEADLEGGYFDGGLSSTSHEKYENVIQVAQSLVDSRLRDLLIARATSGLMKLIIKEQSYCDRHTAIYQDITKALDLLRQVNQEEVLRTLGLWKSKDMFKSTVRFQMVVSRQLIADLLLRGGNVADARSFLLDAVTDAPTDAGASFALGALLLRIAFFGDEITPEKKKEAHVQLLKAAKLDSTKASPFALLGYWYEDQNDIKRAIGCYSKALLLDPSHPVAGRGILRLTSRDSVKSVLDKAINTPSALTGWAWRAIGQQKAIIDGEDELAAIAFLKALRSRDIQSREVESLSIFYSSPKVSQVPSRQEVAFTLADLAGCYWRLGRFTAAIRSFHASIEEAGSNVTSSVLCNCAQVELDLGLYEDAEAKFTQAMDIRDGETIAVATYGRGLSLLAMAKREVEAGKAGSAYSLLLRAIQGCKNLNGKQYGCIQKLLGDLHTLGATLPSDLFLNAGGTAAQLSFIASGENAYRSAERLLEHRDEDEVTHELKASLISDVASNILLQAQMSSFWEEKGLHAQSSPEAFQLYEKSANEYRRAIDSCPIFAPAWCGLGCALAKSDTILAQHAFCRSLQLDNLGADAYSNLSFLYTSQQSFAASEQVSDALTEVADTPMMWINRALISEQKAAIYTEHLSSFEHVRQAADAYRAALQVIKHPSAMLGLAMTCRMPKKGSGSGNHNGQDLSAMKESFFQISEYMSLFGCSELPPDIFDGILKIENVLNNISLDKVTEAINDQIIDEGRKQLYRALDKVRGCKLQDFRGIEMNKDLIQKVAKDSESISQISAHAIDSHEYASTFQLSLDQQIRHEPNRGDLWVKFAKRIALKSLAKTGNNTEHGNLLQAQVAACRAVSILMHQLTESKTKGVFNAVRAEDLSDAYAVKYWVESLIWEDGRGNNAPKENKSLDLQRALIINPGNAIARGALASIPG